LNSQHLLEVFAGTEAEFLTKTEGSAIRRIGYEQWLRNIAVALGNAPASEQIKTQLNTKLAHPSEMVKEHVQWALTKHLSLPRSA
jgi:epoxyqueuosine reductase